MLQPGRLKRLVKINNSCINSFYLLMSTIHCKVFCSTIFTTGKVHDLSFSSGKLESFLDFMGGIFFFSRTRAFRRKYPPKDEYLTGSLTVST